MRTADRLPGFRPDIEGLRGIAILLVVFFHCGLPGFSGGFVGVDVFFVLSGFLITGLLVKEIKETSRLDLLRFYARRARRLLPASALTLVATLLIGAMILAPHELDNTGRASRAAALYASNIFFDKNAGDYFAADVKSNPMLHTWSLAVEEQFYFFWPLLVSLSLVWWRSTRTLIVVILVLTLCSWGVGMWFTTTRGTFAFYELPARAWEFGLGGLAVLLPRGTGRIPFSWWLALGWLGMLAIFASAHFIMGDAGFPGWLALIPVLGTVAGLISWTEYPNRGVGVLLSSAPLQWLGRLSYSWYLWHWPFLVFSAALLPNISIVGRMAAAVASLAVAAMSYHFVEHPVRFHPSLVNRPALSVVLAGALTLCTLGAAFLSIGYADQLANEPRMQTITAAIQDITRLPKEECISGVESSEVKFCHFGNGYSHIRIVLFGDSHAIQWFNPLERIAESNGWKLTTVVKSACPAFDFRPPGLSPGKASACARWRAEALQRIIALQPAVVVMGNLTTSLGLKDKDNPAFTFALGDLQDGAKRTLQSLKSLRVVLMRDTPYFSYDIPTCLARSVRHSWYPGGSCEADRSNVLNAAVFESEQAGARGLSNVHFVDVTDRICQKDICRPVQGQTLIYRDRHHLTGAFADSLIPALNIKLLEILDPSTGLTAARVAPVTNGELPGKRPRSVTH